MEIELFDKILYNGEEHITKCLDCLRRSYEVRNKRLYIEFGQFEVDHSKLHLPYPEYMKWVSHGWKDTCFDGIIKSDLGTFYFSNGELVDYAK